MSDGLIMTKSGANSISEGDIPSEPSPPLPLPEQGQQVEMIKSKMMTEPFPQLPYASPVQYRRPVDTLPSRIAIPAGLAQVFIGGSMVICGSFALRYRSYLFYYGSGLWAGTLAGICGALAVMATKQGPTQPRWLCRGRKWQIHIFILSAMLALTANVLVSLFSTSGLMQDTQYPVGAEYEPLTKDEEIFEQRKSTGIAINAILLLLAMLEILLAFCSLGIALRVLCQPDSSSAPFSSDSGESEVTMRDILGTGPEYEARKDRLLRWLGHQRRNFFFANSNPKEKSIGIANNMSGLVPHFVAVQPQPHPQPHPRFSPPGFQRQQRVVNIYHAAASKPVIPFNPNVPNMQFGYPIYPVPVCPLPVRRPKTPTMVCVTTASSTDGGRRRRVESLSGSGSSSYKSKRSQNQQQTNSTKGRKKGSEKNKEITEEEIGKTYTGLDRQAAEEFISNTMNKY